MPIGESQTKTNRIFFENLLKNTRSVGYIPKDPLFYNEIENFSFQEVIVFFAISIFGNLFLMS